MANNKDFIVKNGIQAVFKETLGTFTDGVSGPDLKNLTTLNADEPLGINGLSGVAINGDGTKLYTVNDGAGGNGAISRFDLSSAFDLSTATASGYSYTMSGVGDARDLVLAKDEKTFLVPDYTDRRIYRYRFTYGIGTLTSPEAYNWYMGSTRYPSSCDLSEDNRHLLVLYTDNNTGGLVLSSYTHGDADEPLKDLTSTGDYEPNLGNVTLCRFSPQGDFVYLLVSNNLHVYKTAAPFSVASLQPYEVLQGVFYANGFTFCDENKKLLVCVGSSAASFSCTTGVKQLDLSSAGVFELTLDDNLHIELINAEPSENVSSATLILKGGVDTYADLGNAVYEGSSGTFNGYEGAARAAQFDPTGKFVYGTGAGSDKIVFMRTNQPFSVANDLQLVSNSVSISSRENNVTSLQVSDDGTKLYFGGVSSDKIWEFEVTSPFRFKNTSAVTDLNRSYNPSQLTNIYDFKVADGGERLYIQGTSDIYQYSLSTPWDITTASYVSKTYDVSVANPSYSSWQGFDISHDGKKLLALCNNDRTCYLFTLSTPWDITTASYDYVSLDLSSEASSPQCVKFANYDTRLLVTDSNASLYVYDIGTLPAMTLADNILFENGIRPEPPLSGETMVITFTTTDGGTSYKASVVMEGLK